ncbi:unnamed protein product [Mytilus coruscus]|uniref:Reverse transcriptase domain-containing protein n=1 Tax=Mytilus coruscus TaxID=42192 RepID=A0A6J8AN33_MYTCO|nr:unnamed protein product [Mytilus coruscus]
MPDQHQGTSVRSNPGHTHILFAHQWQESDVVGPDQAPDSPIGRTASDFGVASSVIPSQTNECDPIDMVSHQSGQTRMVAEEVSRAGLPRSHEYPVRRTFSGSCGDVWNEFLQYFENLAELNAWDSEKSRRVLLSTLRGQAETFAYGLQLVFQRNYDRLKQRMEERFGHTAMKEKYTAEAKLRTMKAGESLRDFGQALEDLYRRAYPGNPEIVEENAIKAFLDKCGHSEDFRLAVQRTRPKTVQSAGLEWSGRNGKDARGIRVQGFKLGETGTEGQVPVTQVRPTNVDRKVRKRKRRRNVRFKEGVTGLRVSSSGSEVAKKEITDVPDTPVERWQSPDPKVKVKGVSSMVVQGQIEGTPVNWKIDTGAKSTFITNETFDLSVKKPTLQPEENNYVVANGHKLKCLGKAMLAITFGENVFEHEVVVGGVRNNLIITAYCCIWDHDEFGFIIKGRRIPLETSKEAVSKRVIALETVMVPAGHEAIIRSGLTNRAKFRRSPSSLGILTPERPFLERHGLALAKTLEDAANEIVFARVYNPGSTEVRVYKHTHIALFTPVCKVGPVLNMNLLDVLEVGEEDTPRSSGALPEHLCSMFGKSCEHLDDDQQEKFKALLRKKQEWVNIRSSSLMENLLKNRPDEIEREDAYPLTRIDENLDTLQWAKWYSSMDLDMAYHQVPMFSEDKEKTAFATPRGGLYQFTTMPFGLCNAANDIVVFGKSFNIHFENLKKVFDRLTHAGLKLKLKKCHFLQKEVSFFGHIVSGEGIRTDPAKVVAVRDMKRPTTVTQVRSFLGLASYYRKYVQDFSKVAKPLFDLTKKNRDLSGMKEPKKLSAT